MFGPMSASRYVAANYWAQLETGGRVKRQNSRKIFSLPSGSFEDNLMKQAGLILPRTNLSFDPKLAPGKS